MVLIKADINQEEKDLKAFNQHPNLAERPEILRSLLLPIEAFVLRTILKLNKPLSTNEVHLRTVCKIWAEKVHSAHPVEYTQVLIPTPKEFLSIKKELREKGIRFPTFEKIDNVLKSLESWGFLTTRTDDYGKANHFWVIHPSLSIETRQKLKNGLGEQEELTW